GRAQRRPLDQHQRLAFGVADGLHPDVADARGVRLALHAGIRRERAALVDHPDLAVAAGRNARLVVGLDVLGAVQELDVRGRALQHLRRADLHLPRDLDARLGAGQPGDPGARRAAELAALVLLRVLAEVPQV